MTRLSNLQFAVLRSLAREPWSVAANELIQWRFNRRWYYLDKQGYRGPIDLTANPTPTPGYKRAERAAWWAAWALVDRPGVKLVEVQIHRGGLKHTPEQGYHLQLRLTAHGEAFIRSIDTRPTPTEIQQPPLPERILGWLLTAFGDVIPR